MKPIPFEGSNVIFKAPANWDAEKYGPCGDLHVYRDEFGCTSCYEFDADDIYRLGAGQKLFLTIQGTQPVISLQVRGEL